MRKLHIFVIFTLKQSRIFLICLSGSLDIVTTFIIKLMRLLKLAVGIQDHIIKTKKLINEKSYFQAATLVNINYTKERQENY